MKDITINKRKTEPMKKAPGKATSKPAPKTTSGGGGNSKRAM